MLWKKLCCSQLHTVQKSAECLLHNRCMRCIPAAAPHRCHCLSHHCHCNMQGLRRPQPGGDFYNMTAGAGTAAATPGALFRASSDSTLADH
jgi:hypothetical protein